MVAAGERLLWRASQDLLRLGLGLLGAGGAEVPVAGAGGPYGPGNVEEGGIVAAGTGGFGWFGRIRPLEGGLYIITSFVSFSQPNLVAFSAVSRSIGQSISELLGFINNISLGISNLPASRAAELRGMLIWKTS